MTGLSRSTLLAFVLAALAAGGGVPSVLAAPACTSDGAVCEGESTYAYDSAAKSAVKGRVTAVSADGKVTVRLPNGKRLQVSRRDVASTHTDACAPAPDGPCSGDRVRGVVGGRSPSKVLAVFPSGYIVVSNDDGKTFTSENHVLFAKVSSGTAAAATDSEALSGSFRSVEAALAASKGKGLAAKDRECEVVPARSSAAAPATHSLAPDTLTRASSLARVLLDETRNAVLMAKVGSTCASFLKSLYRSGKTLYSQKLRSQAIPIKDYSFRSGDNQVDFFHHTRAPSMLDQLHPEIEDRKKAHEVSLRDGSYDELFFFSRTRTTRSGDPVIYVAKDPESSRAWGDLMLQFHLNPEALVKPGGELLGSEVDAELAKSFPELWRNCESSRINLFVAEDSGIDLIDYFDMGLSKAKMWFYLIRPTAITSVELTDDGKPYKK